MNELDLKLKNRYERAWDIICNLPIGDVKADLLIAVANQIKEEEEKEWKIANKSDIGSVSDVEEEKAKAKAAKREAEEEEAWGNLDLGIPKEKTKKEENE
jgi:hypothetical protein